MRLLDDLGWDKHPDRQRFWLKMPSEELHALLERVYWESVASLSDQPGELGLEVREHREALVALCPALLSQIAEAKPSGALVVSGNEASELAKQLTRLAEMLPKE
jgi:hypothetical protein